MPEPYPMPLARQRHTRALVHCLVALQLAQPFVTSARAAELTPVTAGVSLDQAANGVPIVNIATPNAAGISHNQYASFNVGSEGLILNNSAQPVNTQLGGYITGNARLGAGSARLILNEVTTASPSQLNGYMEVAGQRAGVVVANPWGISCNGCGFINTSQATLATGIPLWNSDGSLQGYRVEDGRLRFDGSGLNAGNVDGLALYARVLELNAELYARDLSVVTGANTIDAGTGVATPLAAGGMPSMYAIDSSALGGMYADTIRLVGTEAGVGMRLAAPVAALTGALEVRNNGDVRLARASAQTALDVTAAGGLVLAGDVAAGGNVTLEATGALALADGITLGGDTLDLTAASLTQGAGGSIAARADLTATAAQQTYRGSVGSADSIIITADSVTNSGAVIAGLDLELTAATLDNQGGSLAAGRDLLLNLPTFRQTQTGGTLAAQRLFRVDATGDVVMDGEALELPGDLWLSSTAGDVQVDTRLVSGGSTTLLARDVAVGRDGLVAAQDDLLLEASNVANAGVLFGRQALTLRVENGLVNGRSDGSVVAALLSEGDVSVSTAANGLLPQLYNYGSSIQSLAGNVTLKAADLRNVNVGWSLSDPYRLPSTFAYSIDATSFNSYHYCCGRAGEDVQSTRIETRVTRTDFASEGTRGMILAGGDIRLEAGALLNDHSTISAGGWLDITADSIDNRGTTLYDDIVKVTITRWHTCEYDSMGDLECWGVQWGPVSRPSTAYHDSLPALLEGAAGVIIRGEAANGSEQGSTGNTVSPNAEDFESLHFSPEDLLLTGLDPTALPGFQLPGNGIFQLSQDPAHPYLVETDPALNTYQGFLGSAYLLARLEDWAPGITQRRLGDGYYEITLIRSTLMATLGSRFVDPAITDEREQFQFLMDNAIAASDSLQLSPGIALTREQIDALQADIVWMEERDIAGQRVLVPVVYLAEGSSRVLRDGAVIGGGSIAIEGDSFSNSGIVRATGDLRVSTDGDIANLGGTLSAGGDLRLQSGADISNASGQLSGANVSLVAAGDITHRTTADAYEGQGGSTRFHGTVLGEAASVSATGSVTQVAGGNLTLEGARVSGDDVSLAAGRDLLIGTVKVADGYRFTTADWQAAEEYVRYLQSEVEALGELRLAAAGDVTAIAATLTAGGDATVVAGGNVAFLAETETDHRETHSQHDGTVEDSSSDVVHDEWRTVGTTLTAGGDLAIRAARGDVTLYASTASAAGDADVSAGGTLRLVAGVDTVQHSEQHNEDGLATFANHSEGYVSQRAVASGLQAGGDLTLNAGGNIDIVASTLVADATLRIGGQAVDPALLTPQAAASLPMNVNVTTLALTNTSWSQTQKGFAGPLEEFIKIAAFTIEMVLAPFTLGQVDLPEVKVGEFSSTRTQDVWQVGSTLAAHDMAIQVQDTAAFIGANVTVPGTLSISAQDIVIDVAAETHAYRHAEGSDTVQGLGAEFNKDKGEYRIAGVQETRTSVSDSQQVTEWRGTRIDAGNLILNAEKNIDILGSQLTVIGDALVEAGGDLTIGGREGSVTQEHQETTETITVAVAVRNAYHDAVQSIEALNDAKKAVEDAKAALDAAERKVALGQLAASDLDYFKINVAATAANLAQATLAAAGALATAAATASATAGTGFYASGSAQREKVTTTSTSEQTIWQGSTLAVGGNAALVAGETITIKGSDIAVDKSAVDGANQSDANANLLIIDARKINLIAGQEHSSQTTKTTQETEGVSGSVTPASVTVNANASYRDTEADSSATHYVNSHIRAGMLSSQSEALRVAGAQVMAGDIAIETGQLTVASLQDEARSGSQTRGGSVGVGFGYGGSTGMSPISVSGGIEQSDSSSESRWVSEQTQIIGTNSLRIRAQDTTLTGAIIANADRDANGQLIDKGNLDFQTETLAVHDLQDYQYSKTTGFSLSTTLNTSAFVPNVSGQAVGQTTVGAQYFGHQTEQATRATLGQGNIVVGGRLLDEDSTAAMGLANLNRDLDKAQEITKDQDIGGLNATITVDNRWVTAEGRASVMSDLRNADNNAIGLVKLATATTTAAVVAVASQLSDPETQALAVMANPGRAAEFVKKHPELAAAVEAYQKGEYDGLLKTKEGLQALANALGVNVEVLTTDITARLGIIGTTDGKITALDVTGANRKTLVQTLGHEAPHNQDVENDTLATMAGWATGLGFSAGLDFNYDRVSLATLQLGDGRDATTQAQNALILRADNDKLIKAVADHGEQFENLLSQDQRAAYTREMQASSGLWRKTQVELKWSAQSLKQDGALATGFALGLANGLKGDAQGIATIVSDLPGAVNGIGKLLNDPEIRQQMGQQMHDALQAKYEEVKRLLAHGEDVTDMVGLGANLGELTYEIAGYATLLKGAATAGTKLVARAGEAGGEALETLLRNVTPPPALAVAGGGRVGTAVAAAGKPAGEVAGLGKPVAQMTAGAAALSSEVAAVATSGKAVQEPVAAARAGKAGEGSTAVVSVDDASINRVVAPDIMNAGVDTIPGTGIQTYWPPNGGFMSSPVNQTLDPGYRVSRYGGFYDEAGNFNDFGNFIAPENVPYPMRALPKGTDTSKPYSVYEVIKPIPEVPSGPAAPWFGEIGAGMQHELPLTIQDYFDQGYLRLIERVDPKQD